VKVASGQQAGREAIILLLADAKSFEAAPRSGVFVSGSVAAVGDANGRIIVLVL
jgi:hypothetical protein